MTHSTTSDRRLVIYRSKILPLSETFVRDQARAMSRWSATLVGESLVELRPSMAGVNTRVVFGDSRLQRFIQRVDAAIEFACGISIRKRRLLRKLDPTMIHVHFATDAVRLWPSISGLRRPVVVTLHGYDINTHADWWTQGNGGRRMRAYPARLRAMAANKQVHFIAVSEVIRRVALDYGIPPDRLVVKPIGIETEEFPVGVIAPSRRPARILFVGRLVEKKGAAYLIDAASLLQERVPGLHIVILGDGPLRESLTLQAASLGVYVEFLGAQPHPEVRRQIGLSRALCLPSIVAKNGDAEGFGMVLLEAQCAGVPVVTSAEAGAAEAIIDGVTGFAFEERNVAQLADKLAILMLDGDRVDTMSRSAAALVRDRFDITKCSRALEDYYDELCASAP